jgi:hypothetical protein
LCYCVQNLLQFSAFQPNRLRVGWMMVSHSPAQERAKGPEVGGPAFAEVPAWQAEIGYQCSDVTGQRVLV